MVRISSTSTFAFLAAMAVLAGGCGPGQAIEWKVEFGDPEIATRTAVVRVVIQRGSCGSRSTIEFAHEYDRADPARPSTNPLSPGTYAFTAEAVDAHCTIISSSCQSLEITADGPARVTTILDEVANEPSFCTECTRCGPRAEGGPADAGFDAPGDAGLDDAGARRDAAPGDAATLDGGADAAVGLDGGASPDGGTVPHVDCDGTCDCAALGYEGICVGTASIWWESGCKVRDCAAEGLACGWISDTVGYGCMPMGDGTTTQTCSSVGAGGQCFEDGTLIWYEDGQCRWRDCPAMGRVCGYGGPSTGFNCLPS